MNTSRSVITVLTALIGEIASDDPCEGAAYGAVAGAVVNRRRARRGAAEAQQQIHRCQMG